jgi:pimeloyl-ACP methyl ester carboxylesterase
MSPKKKHKKILAAGAGLAGAGLAAWGFRRVLQKFEREKIEQIQKLEEGSRVVQTARGPVEVAIVGAGPPVLVIHGGAGGYDQGLLETRVLENFKFIAVSRPGYLRTPLETGKTPAEQADALVALLDTLGIKRTAVIGTSMGGMVAMHFALQYPNRCWGLVLVSALNAPLPIRLSALKPLVPLGESDFIPWMLLKPELLYLVRPNLRKQTAEDPQKVEILKKLIQSAYPVSLRTPGMLNDAEQIDSLDDIPLAQIPTPTLVIHGTADNVVPFEHGVRSAEEIPGAKLLPVAGGTHYCILTHLEKTRPAILEFLKQTIPVEYKFRWNIFIDYLKERFG